MSTRRWLRLALTLPILLLAACTSTTRDLPPVQTSQAPTHATEGHPAPTQEMRQLTNAEDGYSLSYPAEYSTSIPGFIVINPAPGPGDVLGDAWASIELEAANGRTAAAIADEQISAVGSGFNIERSETQVDGEPAVIVDGLPGPDSWRKVFVVHGDRLYTLTFLPWAPDPQHPGQPTPLETLYASIMQTLHFMPPTKALPTPPVAWGPDNPPPAFSFEYPQDGQTLDYASDYVFRVTDIPGADGYLWRFTQNGRVVWENLRDELGLTAGGTYAIAAGSTAHGKFVPGPVDVSVSAVQGEYSSEPVVITIVLQQQ